LERSRWNGVGTTRFSGSEAKDKRLPRKWVPIRAEDRASLLLDARDQRRDQLVTDVQATVFWFRASRLGRLARAPSLGRLGRVPSRRRAFLFGRHLVKSTGAY